MTHPTDSVSGRREAPSLEIQEELNEHHIGRRHRVVRFRDGTVGHLELPDDPASTNHVRHLNNLLFIAGQGFPRPIEPLFAKKGGRLIGFRRRYIAYSDPFWRSLYPNLSIRTFLRMGILIAQHVHAFHIHTDHVVTDITPHNLCFDPVEGGFWPVLIDIDRARPIGTIAGHTTEHGKHVVIGSPLYLTPEHIAFTPQTPASDECGVALLLASVALRTEGWYVPGEGGPERRARQRAGQYPYRHLLAEVLPAPLTSVLVRSLDRDPSARHGSCRGLAEALRLSLRQMTHDERHRILSSGTYSPELLRDVASRD